MRGADPMYATGIDSPFDNLTDLELDAQDGDDLRQLKSHVIWSLAPVSMIHFLLEDKLMRLRKEPTKLILVLCSYLCWEVLEFADADLEWRQEKKLVKSMILVKIPSKAVVWFAMFSFWTNR